jgi:hypothetical protein
MYTHHSSTGDTTMIEVTVSSTGKTVQMTAREFYKTFGKAEGKEILAGYLSGEITAYRVKASK